MTETKLSAEQLIRGIVQAALELAVIRCELCREDESPLRVEQCAEIVEDTWNALRGIDTCLEEPAEEYKALLAHTSTLERERDEAKVYGDTQKARADYNMDRWDAAEAALAQKDKHIGECIASWEGTISKLEIALAQAQKVIKELNADVAQFRGDCIELNNKLAQAQKERDEYVIQRNADEQVLYAQARREGMEAAAKMVECHEWIEFPSSLAADIRRAASEEK